MRTGTSTYSSGNCRYMMECIDSSSAHCRSPYGQIFPLSLSFVRSFFYDIGDERDQANELNVQVAGNMFIDIDENHWRRSTTFKLQLVRVGIVE